jgi:hypothetical protein
MAQSVTVTLIDDLDGKSGATETVRFGVDGAAYEIDLSARHADQLRKRIGRYVAAARKVRPAPRRARRQRQPRTRTQTDREQSRRIRSWAMERELLTSARGRIPQHVVVEYEAAMRVVSAPSKSPGTAEPGPASIGGTIGKASRKRIPRAARARERGAGPSGGAKGGAPLVDSSVLSKREQGELRKIAGTARPGLNVIAGRLRKRGLVDRDSAGNWSLTDAGRQLMVPA